MRTKHRLARYVAMVLLVLGTCVGLIVSQPGQAQALAGWPPAGWTVGPADRMMIRAVGGALEAPAPGVLARGARTCTKPSPAAAACALGILAFVALGASKDLWWPWMLNKLGYEELTTTNGQVSKPCASVGWAGNPPSTGMTVGGFPGLTITNTGPGHTGTGTNGTSCDVQFEVTSSVKSTQGTVKTKTTPALTQVFRCPPTCTIGGGNTFGGNGALWPVGVATTDQILWVRLTPVGQGGTVATGEGSSNGFFFKSALSDADVAVTTRVTCKRSDGTTYNVDRTGVPDLGFIKVGYCTAGDTNIGWKMFTNGAEIPDQDINTEPDPADDQKYALCAGAACNYTLKLDNQPCIEGDGRCEDWARVAKESPGRVTCYYGPYKLTIEDCYWMERAFADRPYPVTAPNMDGDPDTVTLPSGDPSPSPSPTTTPGPSPTPSPGPAPTVTASPTAVSPGTCTTPYNLGAVQSQTAALVNNLAPRFGIITVYGWREADAYPDHPSGLAADFMVYTNTVKGDSLATYAIQNAPALNVDYVIWKQRIWSLDRAAEGWRVMADRGSPTANHMDHVHVTTKSVAGSLSCSGDPGDSDPGSDACWPSGWGVLNPGTWVLMPIKCAFKWAFVPSSSGLQSAFGPVQTAWANSTPAKWSTALTSVVTDVDIPSANCAGPTVDITLPKIDQAGSSSTQWQPLNACSEPFSKLATLLRTALTAGCVVGGAFTCVRVLAAGISYTGVSSQ